MSDDYNFHLNSPGSMVSNSLSHIINSADGASPDGSTQEIIRPEINNQLLIASSEMSMVSKQVAQVSVDEEVCKIVFDVTSDKAIKSQAFYGAECNITFGSLCLTACTCVSWEYNADNRIVMIFQKQKDD